MEVINIQKEDKYLSEVDKEKQKKYGQHFTPPEVANYMAKWVGKGAEKALDPASGNGVFFKYMRKHYKNIKYTGYEIDKEILEYFKINDNVILKDFLLTDFSNKYDAIICNSPYNKFQTIENRDKIKDNFYKNLEFYINGYTNQYIYFLIKCIYQLEDGGRLAFIVPTEFLNSKYGEQAKDILLKEKLIKEIINLDYNVFKSATTTSCILLIEKKEKEEVILRNMKSLNDLNSSSPKSIPYNNITAKEKWSKYLYKEKDSINNLFNLIPLNTFAKVSRGISTGCNEFFLLNKEEVNIYKINSKYLTICISRSNYINNPFFKEEDMKRLIEENKKVFLLDIKDNIDDCLKKYIELGVSNFNT